ncbi:MAG TPA: DUF1631 family protein, partial [Ramlibacter sp.]|nr:DUF1631 family protein [Ramlibacter sp.]
MDAQAITNPTAPTSFAMQQCFDEVTDSAPMALERCLNAVVTELQQAEGKSPRAAERTELGDAWRELLRHQAAWCKLYPDQLRAAFNKAGNATERATSRTGKLELSLVDENAIDGEIESSRMLRDVMPLVERPVSELDALVSSAMGLDGVRPEMNPVRPEVFAQGLRALMDRSEVKPATGALWMRYMAEPLGHELQQLYGRLVIQLKDANVRAAEYRVTQTAGGPAAPRATAATATGDAKTAQPSTQGRAQSASMPGDGGYAELSSRQISHALLRDFLHNGGGAQATQMPPPSYYAEVEREIAQLKAESRAGTGHAPEAPMPASYRELPPVDRPLRAVGVQSALSSEVWGDYAESNKRSLVRAELRKDATQLAQVLGLELVRKVVNQIAQDPRLLTPVREAIVALEPSLLRLAMVDPRFFTEEQHPGRKLMESAAQRSFKYNDEFGIEFSEFFDGISASFNGLNQATIENARPFEEALRALQASWAAQDKLENDPRAQALKAMGFAEKRQAEAGQIAWEMSSRTDLADVPSVVQDFLFGPWALVLAHARLTTSGNQIDPHGFLAVIPDLLWSVKPEVTLRQPAQLFARLPSLLDKLRSGLALLGQQPEESEPFFQELMKLHRPVLKLRRAKSRRDAKESGVAPLAAVDTSAISDSKAPIQKVEDGKPWMSAHEQDALGFEETLPTDMAQLWAQDEVPPAAPERTPAAVAKPARAEAAPAAPPTEFDAAVMFADL